jgi:hypothetical protein
MNLNPCLHQFQPRRLDRSLEHIARRDGQHGGFLAVFHVNVRQMVLLVIKEVHHHDDAIEH